MAQEPNVTTPTQYRDKSFTDECYEADPQMNAPVDAYRFTGRTFRVDGNKPYDAPK